MAIRAPDCSKRPSLLNLSLSHLAHRFTEEVGISPFQYAKLISLCKARELIETTHLSIKQIASTAGYSSPSRFAIDFQKAMGASPTRHRARSLFISDTPPNSDSRI